MNVGSNDLRYCIYIRFPLNHSVPPLMFDEYLHKTKQMCTTTIARKKASKKAKEMVIICVINYVRSMLNIPNGFKISRHLWIPHWRFFLFAHFYWTQLPWRIESQI